MMDLDEKVPDGPRKPDTKRSALACRAAAGKPRIGSFTSFEVADLLAKRMLRVKVLGRE